MELAPGKITIASTDGSYMVYSKEFPSEQVESADLLINQKAIKVLTGIQIVKGITTIPKPSVLRVSILLSCLHAAKTSL
jgi:hypothetical protein